jgi:hypothetical protein
LALAQPQPPTPIEPETPLVVTLDGSGAAVVTYESSGSETVQIIARALSDESDAGEATDEAAPPLDTVIEVVSPSRERLAYNDDYFPALLDDETAADLDLQPTDSAITALALDEAGTYEIRVNSFNGVSVGDVELQLVRVEPLIVESQLSDDVFTASVTLRPNQMARIDVELEAARTVTITARDPLGVLDAVLQIRDADGAVLESNDDGGFIAGDGPRLNIFDSRIADFTPSASGTYSLIVRDYLGRSGTLELEVRSAE